MRGVEEEGWCREREGGREGVAATGTHDGAINDDITEIKAQVAYMADRFAHLERKPAS